MIGDHISKEAIGENIIEAQVQSLNDDANNVLWSLFIWIGKIWMESSDASSFKPQWEEFVRLRIEKSPSYAGEYQNACDVINELIVLYGEKEAYFKLLMDNEIGDEGKNTRLGHTKQYVANEFIKVFLTVGGFKEYGARNYNSFIGGPRNMNPSPYRSINE